MTNQDDMAARFAAFQAWEAAQEGTADSAPAERTEPAPYAGPAGFGQLAAPLQPDPEPPPGPAAPPAPHPDETFAPGELAVHEYHDHRDPEGVIRQQLVMVAHQTADHVAAMVIGDLRELAMFGKGLLSHYGQAVK